MYNLAIIQARMGSSRLPGKVLMNICNKTVLDHVIDRVQRSSLIDEVIVATTIQKEDIPIVSLCSFRKIRVYCGSENDVLDRFYQAARLLKPDNIIRITADCPLIDPEIIDEVIQKHIDTGSDYTSNIIQETFPDGLDCEIMKFGALKEAWEKSVLQSEREHVTPYIKKQNIFKKYSVTDCEDHSSYRWTLDTKADFEFISIIYQELYKKNLSFNRKDIYALLNRKPAILEINRGIVRNEGYRKSVANDKISRMN